jgi:endoglycosylceramidase
LAISWSLLEETPGDISEEYLERIEQIVGWGAEQGLAFIIDMHADFYSHALNPGAGPAYKDGAPAWAVLNSTIDKFPK